MKLGTEDTKKTWIAITLFVLALAAIMYEVWPSPSAPAAARPVAQAQKGSPVFSKLDPSLRADLLKGSESVSYSGSGRDIFHAQAEPKKEDLSEVGKAGDPRVTATRIEPPKPTIPLKFYGFASANNKKRIFLSQGEDIFVASEGDIVKGRYKIVHVNPNNVEIQDVLANFSQQIPLSVPNS